MAITLPDFTALPDVTPRAVGGIPSLPQEDAGAAGEAVLGKGLTAAGGAVTDIAAYRQVARNRMEQALADASFLGRSVKLDAELKRETDPEKIAQLGQTYQAALADASNSIADPGARDLWLAHNAHKVATGQAQADLRNTDIYHDRYRAGADALLADNINIATSHEDPARRAEAQKTIGEIIEGLRASGSISADKAQEMVTKTGQNIILGHAAYLDATERSAEAKTFLEQNAQHVPAHLLDTQLHSYTARAKVQQGEALADRPVGGGAAISAADHYNYLTSIGATPNEAALLTSAAQSESGFNPAASHDAAALAAKGLPPGYGLYGHNGPRLVAMQRAAGSGAPSWQDQVKFALDELRSRPEGAQVNAAKTADQLTDLQLRFEQPGPAGINRAGRLAATQRYMSNPPTAADTGAAPVGVPGEPSEPPIAGVDYPYGGTAPAPAAGAASGAALPAGTPAAVGDSAAARQSVLDIEKRHQAKMADIEGDPNATQEVKDIAARKESARYTREKATISDFARKEAATVNKLSRDDESSIINSGVPVAQLTTDRVRNALGDDAAEAFDERRAAQLQYYENWHDMENLTQPEIDARLLETKPKPGAPGHLANQVLYDLAHKNAVALQKQRIVDPAGSVATAPAVAAAAQTATLERPETYLPLVAARGMAMDGIGIPKANQVPITNAEALELWKPIGLVTEGGTPAQIKAELTQVIKTLQAATGDQADKGLEAVLRAGHASLKTAEDAASVLKKIHRGEKLTQADTKAFDDAQKDDAAARAAAPMIIDPVSGTVVSGDLPQPSVAPSVPPPTFPAPSEEAVQLLSKQPERAEQFNTVYGPGQAEKVLRIVRPDLKAPAPTPAKPKTLSDLIVNP